MVNVRSPYGARRLALGMFALLLAALPPLPGQSQNCFTISTARLVNWSGCRLKPFPRSIRAFAMWEQYVSLQHGAEKIVN